MSSSSFTQTSFVGGEWSPYAQGGLDNPSYRKALALCKNAIPLEEGAWVRRSGTMHAGTTLQGKVAKIFQYAWGNDAPYSLEITWDGSNSHIAIWRNYQQVTDVPVNTLDNSNPPAGTPATFTTSVNHGWATNNVVQFFPTTTSNARNLEGLLNRTFIITVTGVKTFTMVDAVTGTAVNAADFTYDATVTNTVKRITVFSAPYTSAADVQNVRAVMVGDGTLNNVTEIILCHPSYAPVVVQEQFNSTYSAFTFVKTTLNLVDGPYLPTQEGGTMTLGGASGTQTFSHTGNKINSGNGFTSADVGRYIRLLTEPTAWNSGTNYNQGDQVTRGTYPNSFYYVALVANTNSVPEQNLGITWVPYLQGRNWTYATITTVTNDHQGTLTFQGPAAAYSANCTYWTMDYYNAFWGYPTGGLFSGGRLILFGTAIIHGTINAGVAGNYFTFSPSDAFGNVIDSSAFQYQITDPNPTDINWFFASDRGIVAGLTHSEWLLRGDSTNENLLTPTNLQIRKQSIYGSAIGIDPIQAGPALIFIDRTYRRVMELLPDTFSSKFFARSLNEYARHFGANQFQRLAYTDNLVPTIWTYDANGAWYGCNYRRTSPYSSQPPELMSWHQHNLGTGWTVTSMCNSADVSANAAGDQLYLCVNDGTHYHIELPQPLFDTNASLINSWFLDSAPRQVQCRDPALDGGSAGIKIWGLTHLNGKTVTVMIAGLNFGTQTVSGGTVTVNYAADPDGLGTATYLQSLSGAYTYGSPLDLKISGVRAQVTLPVVVGMPYTSEGQLMRPDAEQMLKQQNGPGLGKQRKLHMGAWLLNNTPPGPNFGTSSSNAYPADFRTLGGVALQKSVGFSGVYWNVLNDPSSFDGQLYWNTSAPYPMAVMSASGFLTMQDR